MAVNVDSVKQVCRALEALGERYRADWSEVDGRTIRYEMNTATDLIERALTGESVYDEAKALTEEWTYEEWL